VEAVAATRRTLPSSSRNRVREWTWPFGLAAVARDLGGLQSFSDRVGELDDGGLDSVRALLTDGGSLNVPSPGRIAAAVGLALKRHRHEPAGRQSLADRIDPYVELLHPDDAVEPRPVRLTRTSDGLEPGATEG
jgi:hypothetical protein